MKSSNYGVGAGCDLPASRGGTLEMFAPWEHCCATCGEWQGARIISECGYVHALKEVAGYCRQNGGRKGVFGACTGWELWPEAAQ